MKKLIKSYRFWTALAGALGLLAVSIAKVFGHTMSSVVVEELVMAICGVLVVLGIVKKPENLDQTTQNNNQDKPTEQSKNEEHELENQETKENQITKKD